MLTEVAQVSPKIGMKTECHRRQNANFWEKETRSFAFRWKDRNWSKRRTLCIWEGISAHKRGLTRLWKGELGWRGELGRHWGRRRTRSKELSKATKTCMYEMLMLSTLLYNAETWTMTEKQKQRLRVFEMACLRKIEGVTRRDRIRNEEIFNRLN